MFNSAALGELKEGDYVKFTEDAYQSRHTILLCTYVDREYVYLRMHGHMESNHRASKRNGEMRVFKSDSWELIEGTFQPYDSGWDI